MVDVWKEIEILALRVKNLVYLNKPLPKKFKKDWGVHRDGRFSFTRKIDVVGDIISSYEISSYFGRDIFRTGNKNRSYILNLDKKEIEKIIYLDYYGNAMPKFDFHWSIAGKLAYLRIDLAGNTFVNFLRSEFRTGDPKLLEEIPQNLDGVDEILDIHIYHQINPAKEAEKILAMSGLRELVLSWKK